MRRFCRNLVDKLCVLLMKGHRELSREIRNSWYSYLGGIYRVYQSTDLLFHILTISMSAHSLNLNLRKKIPSQSVGSEGWRDCPSRAMWVVCIVWIGKCGKVVGSRKQSSSWFSLQGTHDPVTKGFPWSSTIRKDRK